jgi:hypothetical protein
MNKTAQNFNTIANNAYSGNGFGQFPDLKSEKVANRLLKRQKNGSEIGYLNFPSRSTNKIKQMHNEDELMKKNNLVSLKNEMMQRSAAVGGALTQFKKKKQRRMIKQLMEENAGNYGSR